MTVGTGPDAWEPRFSDMRKKWSDLLVEAEVLPERWSAAIAALQERRDRLKHDGYWRSGPRSLLAATGRHQDELTLTAGLAWLLMADGHHGLGGRVLNALLTALKLPKCPAGDVRVVLEELRGDTRADLVVYSGTRTVVIEAKTYAVEQPEQCDRLVRHWSDEVAPAFVFLTRGRRRPVTAVASRNSWHNITWADVAALVRQAAVDSRLPSAGVHEYLDTLEAYHRVS